MDFDKFKLITDQMVKMSSRISSAHTIGLDTIEMVEPFQVAISYLWSEILTPDGFEWLEWFLYEKNYLEDGIGRPDMTAYHTVNDEQIEIVKDLEGLHQYLLENNYFKCVSQK